MSFRRHSHVDNVLRRSRQTLLRHGNTNDSATMCLETTVSGSWCLPFLAAWEKCDVSRAMPQGSQAPWEVCSHFVALSFSLCRLTFVCYNCVFKFSHVISLLLGWICLLLRLALRLHCFTHTTLSKVPCVTQMFLRLRFVCSKLFLHTLSHR